MDHYATSEFVLVYKGEVVLSSEMYTLDAIKDGAGQGGYLRRRTERQS